MKNLTIKGEALPTVSLTRWRAPTPGKSVSVFFGSLHFLQKGKRFCLCWHRWEFFCVQSFLVFNGHEWKKEFLCFNPPDVYSPSPVLPSGIPVVRMRAGCLA